MPYFMLFNIKYLDIAIFWKPSIVFFRENSCMFKISSYLCTAFNKKALLKRSFGEVAEWSIAAVLKTVVPRGTRGSNPCLSAEITGQNRTVNRQVPQIQ